jgi:hypothetical protein
MIDQCFISVSPVIMLGISLVITAYAIWRVFMAYHGEKTSFVVVMAFLVMTALSYIFIPCWAFVVSLIELAVAIYLRSTKMHEMLVK